MPASLWFPAVAPHQFHSNDLDEVREYMDGHNGTHWRHALRPGPVGFRLAHVKGVRTRLAWCGMDAPQAIRGAVDTFTVHVTLAGRTIYRFGRREIATHAGDLAFLPPGRDLTIESQSARRIALQVPPEVTQGEPLAGLRHGRLSPEQVVSLLGLLEGLARAASAAPSDRRAALSHAESRVADWALALLPRDDGRRPAHLARVRVRRLEEWIEAHLHDSISLPRLCELAGVRARCLQAAFAMHRGQSPMEFVAERRLSAAHDALARGEYGSVIAAASAFGFEHPGRFAASYRRLFGLAPSEVLRRSRSCG